MREWTNKTEVLQLLCSGKWEIGYSDGIRLDGRYWMQEGGLCKGGKTKDVHGKTMNALLKDGLVELVPRTEKQPFWLRRYRLTEKGGSHA